MLIIPAIDISEGKCVRLKKGDFNVKTIYGDDPVAQAKQFEKEGAKKLHIIDLDGAKTGQPKNMELIIKLRKAIKIPVEVGGGIRDFVTAQKYLASGIDQIILGTKALDNTALLAKLMEKYGDRRIIVALDVKNGRIMEKGWQLPAEEEIVSFVRKLKSLGIKIITVTDVNRDGTLTRPNFALVRNIKKYGFEIIAAGGITNEKDLDRLKTIGVEGSIIGKALYEGTLSLPPRSDLTKRIIPCLDVAKGRVVKGVHFKNCKDAGDPVELGKRYAEGGADELVFLDITASKEKRATMREVVKRIAQEIFIPFTVGGGIRTVDDIRILLASGAEKIALNTTAVLNPSLISEAAAAFGSQCIVVAIDVKKDEKNGKYMVYIKGGTQATLLNADEWAKHVEKLGAGEILLTSMDTDGTKKGFDIPLLQKISRAVKIPVIASGGAGSLKDFKDALTRGNADAVLAASLFHFNLMSIQKVKKYLESQNIPIRL